MKQLSIRLFAPISIAYSLLARFVHFSIKKTSQIATLPQVLTGKWRLLWNYCPECNSCAPKIHHCDVCEADTKSHFYWSKEVEQTWWKRYAKKHHLVAE